MLISFLRSFASLKLTIALLLWLCVLLVWGTLYQVDHGLFMAQNKFFNSYFVEGLFPSARTILMILFFNLAAAFFTKFRYSLRDLPLLCVHSGLILLLISGFITLNFSQEAFITLKEGERTNLAYDYHTWIFDVVKSSQQGLNKLSYPLNELREKQKITIDSENIIQLQNLYTNAYIFDTPFAGRILKKLEQEKDFEKNIPAIVLKINGKIIELQGEQQNTFEYKTANSNLYFILKRQSYTLPFAIELEDVSRELYSGTEIAKSYKSQIIIHENSGAQRPFAIEMNKPFRYQDYTLYQNSFMADEEGNEATVLALVKSPNYFLAYIASLLTAFGLFLHFGVMFGRNYSKDHEVANAINN